jgi:hypothetical protein
MLVRYSHFKPPTEIDTSREDQEALELMRRANDVGGNRHYGDMAEANLPMHIRRGVIQAAIDSGETNLDLVTRRNDVGNSLKNVRTISKSGRPTMVNTVERREILYMNMKLAGYSFPEIASGFFTSHSTVQYAVRRVKTDVREEVR